MPRKTPPRTGQSDSSGQKTSKRSETNREPTRDTLEADLRKRFGLTRMEAAVVSALADGMSYSEIAARYGVSYHTVHSHVKAIHRKTDVSSTGRLLATIRKEAWWRG